jgi:hypothetical protein
MVTYGETSWAVALSTGKAGGVPSGDIFYLFQEMGEDGTEWKSKILNVPGGVSIALKTGKRRQYWKIINAVLLYPDDVAHNNAHINNFKTVINTSHKQSGAGLYLWVEALLGTGTPYIKWADGSETMQNYMLGFFTKVQIKHEPDKLPRLSGIFVEANG